MKKLSVLSLFVLLLSMNFVGCTKVVEPKSEKTSDFELAEKAGGQSFESSLNEIYTSKSDRPIISKTISYPFTHTNGVISEAEKNEIILKVSNTTYMGRTPYAIDVNYKESTIDIIFASITGDNLTHGDVLFNDGQSCDTYDKRLATATDCGENGTDYFNGMTDEWWDGGLAYDGSIIPGHFCDTSIDGGGGACGKVATTFLSNNPMPSNHLHWEDIKTFDLLGDEELTIIDFFDTPDGIIEVTSPLIWYFNSGDPYEKQCFSNADLNEYYCNIFEVVDLYLPSGYYVIDATFARSELFGTPPDIRAYWYIKLRVGKSVSCCDCCC